jgi:hypothetical protein
VTRCSCGSVRYSAFRFVRFCGYSLEPSPTRNLQFDIPLTCLSRTNLLGVKLILDDGQSCGECQLAGLVRLVFGWLINIVKG